jgi:hypothetical protein
VLQAPCPLPHTLYIFLSSFLVFNLQKPHAISLPHDHILFLDGSFFSRRTPRLNAKSAKLFLAASAFFRGELCVKRKILAKTAKDHCLSVDGFLMERG